MIPPRMTRTVTAAARVRFRNAASPKRRRWRTRARSTWLAIEIVPPCNVTSTTGGLPAGCIRLSLGFRPFRGAAQRPPRPQPNPPMDGGGGQGKGALGRPFPTVVRSVCHRENGLAIRVLDLTHPGLLDIRGHIGWHRNI